MMEHIERLEILQLVALPQELDRQFYQNRLLKLDHEGGQMTPQDLGKFESERRYATLVAVVLESTATVTYELVDLHVRILIKLFSSAKNKQQFQKQSKAINDKVASDAPTALIKPRWKPLVITPEGTDRRFYELCALSELKNALRSRDIWMKGSRQFRDFEDYLQP